MSRRVFWRRTGPRGGLAATAAPVGAHENQARRLLNDLARFRAELERRGKRPLPESVAVHRWLAEVFEPAVAAIPVELWGKRQAAEVFHELLEHRWFLSERAGREVDTADAVCTPDDCPAVLGNVLVYLDDNHLSASYTTSMAPLLADRIQQSTGAIAERDVLVVRPPPCLHGGHLRGTAVTTPSDITPSTACSSAGVADANASASASRARAASSSSPSRGPSSRSVPPVREPPPTPVSPTRKLTKAPATV